MKHLAKLLLFIALGSVSISSYSKSLDVYYYDSNDIFFDGFDFTLQHMCKTEKMKTFTHDGKFDRQLQMTQIENNFNLNSDVIVNLVDVNDAQRVVELARNVDATVVFFNRMPSQDVIDSYDKAWYVGADGINSGASQFKMILDYLQMHPKYDKNSNGSLDFILLQGEQYHSDTIFRTKSIIDSFQSQGMALNLLSNNYDNWSYDKAYKDVRVQIRTYGIENIEMIIANNDNMAMGAIKALNEIGYNLPNAEDDSSKYIPVFGIDGIKDAIKAVDAGMLTGTTYCDYSALAKACIKIIQTPFVSDEDLEKQIWYKVQDRNVQIQFQNYAKFKNYSIYYRFANGKQQ